MPRPSSRVTNVQVPGETAASDTAAVTQREPKAAAPDPKLIRPGRAQYAQMRAADIDPSTLTTAVLTLDGWLCPPAMTTKI